jgi:glucose-6-phosphate isomerase
MKEGLAGLLYDLATLENAVEGTSVYLQMIQDLLRESSLKTDAVSTLIHNDVKDLAQLILPSWEESDGAQGWVCVPLHPKWGPKEALQWSLGFTIPNVMAQITSSPQGLLTARELLAHGVSLAMGPIAGPQKLKQAARACCDGLLQLSQDASRSPKTRPLHRVAVAFHLPLDEIDMAVDPKLSPAGRTDLLGRTAISCTRVLLETLRETISEGRWRKVLRKGIKPPMLLLTFSSPPLLHLNDGYYLSHIQDEGIIWALPWSALWFVLGRKVPGEPQTAQASPGLSEARDHLETLKTLGVDMEQTAEGILRSHIERLEGRFSRLLQRLGRVQEGPSKVLGRKGLSMDLCTHEKNVQKALERSRRESLLKRMWLRDHSIWKRDPTEITNRLGWMRSPNTMGKFLPTLRQFADEVQGLGLSCGYLLGMGGSSLAPEVFIKTFGTKEGSPAMGVLDTTDPFTVQEASRRIELSEGLFIVSTKSGTTVETISLFKYFYNRLFEAEGGPGAGRHFAAITDPGSPLAAQAHDLSFLHIFLNDPEVGGRYSALSYFGLVMASLIGMDLEALLHSAQAMWANCHLCNCPVRGDNSGVWLGCALGELALRGRDKLTLHASESLSPMLPWIEQLIAESTGKESKGILPVIGEDIMPSDAYAPDRVFVSLRLRGEGVPEDFLEDMASAGHPVIHIELDDLYSIGGEFFRWELATAVAAWRLGINPFDQPNVESAKRRAKEALSAKMEGREMPQPRPTLRDGDIMAFCHPPTLASGRNNVPGLLEALLKTAQIPGSYVAIQAYLPPGAEMDSLLGGLRGWIRAGYPLATTVGYGPRFLHSTGQLHKGDAGRGLFIQITYEPPVDIPIPSAPGQKGSSVTFGDLLKAQALGDFSALKDAKRRIVRLHLPHDPLRGMRELLEMLGQEVRT